MAWSGRTLSRRCRGEALVLGHDAAVDRMFLDDLPGSDNAEPFALANFICAYVVLDTSADEPLEKPFAANCNRRRRCAN
jgi:hypothetical protein